MKQHEDHKTLDLLESPKRGRGRPRLESAKSQAERARLYRLNKKLNPASIKSDVTDNDILSLSARNKELNDLLGKRDAEILALEIKRNSLSDELFLACQALHSRDLEIAELKVNKVTRNEKSLGRVESELVLAIAEIGTLTQELDAEVLANIALRRDVVRLTKENGLIKRDASQNSSVKPSRKTVTKKSAAE